MLSEGHMKKKMHGRPRNIVISVATIFKKWDYTLLPSPNGTYRLKNNAVPSVFPTCPSHVLSYNITEDARKRLEIPQKQPLFQDDELSPSAKVQCDHN